MTQTPYLRMGEPVVVLLDSGQERKGHVSGWTDDAWVRVTVANGKVLTVRRAQVRAVKP
jgi:hypothetical protein